VKVEVFSLGFGKKLLKWKKEDTIYCISLVPLGGYVKMFGFEHEREKKFSEEEKKVAFVHKKLWQRFAIVLAGPLMNFFLAIFIFSTLYLSLGEEKAHPILGELEIDSQASKAGLEYGDKILSIDGKEVKSVREVNKIIAKKPNILLTLKIKKPNGEINHLKVLSKKDEVPGRGSFLELRGVIEGLNFSVPAAIVGVIDPNSAAGKAGIKTFDEVLSINDKKVTSQKDLIRELKDFSKAPWTLKIKREKKNKTLTLDLPEGLIVSSDNANDLKYLGLASADLFIAELKKGGAADKAGLKTGDFIWKLNGQLVSSWKFLTDNIKNFKEADGALNIEIKRDGKRQMISVTPEIKTRIINAVETKHYMLGIVTRSPHVAAGGFYKEKEPLKAVIVGLEKTFYFSGIMGVYIKKLISGEISRKTLGGAISVGRVAYDSYSSGLEDFFKIMAILSVQLFIINILPIPILDGGYLLFYAIELFSGAPLSAKKMLLAQQAGLLILLMLLIFTTFNDLHNWFFIW